MKITSIKRLILSKMAEFVFIGKVPESVLYLIGDVLYNFYFISEGLYFLAFGFNSRWGGAEYTFLTGKKICL